MATLLVARAEPPLLVYVGTYTHWEELGPGRRNPPGEPSHGIYLFRLDPARGTLTPLGLAAESRNPTFLAITPSGRRLYAANETYHYNGAATGALSAFDLDPASGRLELLNQVSAEGTGTCQVALDPRGKFLLAANFGSGSATVFPLEPTGRIGSPLRVYQDRGVGPNPRQDRPHAHAFTLSPDGTLAVISEFGSDKLVVTRSNPAKGPQFAPSETAEVSLHPGSAPRHLAFRPDGRTAYSVNEIENTVTVLDVLPENPFLRARQTISSLPQGYEGRNTAAEVVVDPRGRFLYVSNRGHHSLAVFAIEPSGDLRWVTSVDCGGRTPRGFSLDPSGRWLVTANQDTHNLALFRIEPETGIPRSTGVTAEVRSPVCVTFAPAPAPPP